MHYSLCCYCSAETSVPPVCGRCFCLSVIMLFFTLPRFCRNIGSASLRVMFLFISLYALYLYIILCAKTVRQHQLSQLTVKLWLCNPGILIFTSFSWNCSAEASVPSVYGRGFCTSVKMQCFCYPFSMLILLYGSIRSVCLWSGLFLGGQCRRWFSHSLCQPFGKSFDSPSSWSRLLLFGKYIYTYVLSFLCHTVLQKRRFRQLAVEVFAFQAMHYLCVSFWFLKRLNLNNSASNARLYIISLFKL